MIPSQFSLSTTKVLAPKFHRGSLIGQPRLYLIIKIILIIAQFLNRSFYAKLTQQSMSTERSACIFGQDVHGVSELRQNSQKRSSEDEKQH